MMIEWEEFLTQLQRQTSVGLRIEHGSNLVDDLSENKLCSKNGRGADLEEARVIEEISQNWIASSNYKVSRLGIDLLNEVVVNLGPRFRSSLSKVIDQLLSTFGDSRTQDAAIQMFINVFVVAFNGPDALTFERILIQSWNDRMWRVREGGCYLLRHTLDATVGGHFDGQANQIGLSKLISKLVSLADNDKQPEVREAAVEVLMAGYRCFGEKIKNDIIKKRPKRLNHILEKFDECEPCPSASAPVKQRSRPSSRNDARPPMSAAKPKSSKKPGPDGDKFSAGAVGVAELEAEYEHNIPTLSSSDTSDRNVDQLIEKAHQRLISTSTEWEDRNKELRIIRALALRNLLPHGPEFRKFAPPFTQALADLRSQVTREACVTLGLLSREIDVQSFGQMANLGVISQLIKLIPNSAKIMSTSAYSCLSVILRDCHYVKFPPHFTDQLMNSKSIQIRRKCIELTVQILGQWDQSEIYRSNDDIVKAMMKTLEDPDHEVRSTAREAFFHYSAKFRDESDQMRLQMSANVRKMLVRPVISRSGSTESIASTDSKQSSNGSRTPGRTRPKLAPKRPPTNLRSRINSANSRPCLGPKSTSDLVLGSTAQLRVYPVRGTPIRTKFKHIESVYSQKTLGTPKTVGNLFSQPSSRSSSPPHSLGTSTVPRKRLSGSRIPRSAASSREASPEDFRYARRILPPGAAGQRIINNLLGMEQIVPSQTLGMLVSAKTNAEKKDALNQIGKMADQKQGLSPTDLRRVTEQLQKIIFNGNEKVLIPAFKIIPKVLKTYAHEEPMKDWLYSLLTGILKRLNQLLGDSREAALEVLQSITTEYPKELQYERVTKFLLDHTEPTTGQKTAILRFLRDLTPYLESPVLKNSAETRLVMSRLVSWGTQKSPEVRSEANAAIRALFALNPGQFSAALQELPKPFQEGVSSALRVMSSDTQQYLVSNSPDTKYPRSKSSMQDYSSGQSYISSNFEAGLNYYTNQEDTLSKQIKDMTLHYSHKLGKIDNDEEFVRAEKTLQLELDCLDTTAGVLEPIPDISNRPGGHMPSLLIDSIKFFQKRDGDSVKLGLKKVRDAIKDSGNEDWDRQWPRVFPLLLEIASDSSKQNEERIMSLHCLRDAVGVRNELMTDSAEEIVEKYLAIMSSDPDDRSSKDISRASQNAALALLRNVTIWKSLSILANHVSETVPTGRDSIDMCRLLVEDKCNAMTHDSIHTQQAQNAVHQLMPRLMKQWGSEHPAVRKAVVYCLVVIFLARKEIVEPYLTEATQTNRRLFDLYLKKHSPENS